jgi:hypothetical protein
MLFWKKAPREEGISCVVRAKNEENWLRMSLLSIKDFADEIIFVDNASTDRTLEIARRFQEEFFQDRMKIFTFPAIDGRQVKAADLYTFSFRQATKSWLMKWDADFIGRTEGPFSMLELKKLWHDQREKVDKFRLSAPNLWGDHEHFREVWPGQPEFCFENYLWRNRDWEYVMESYEVLRLKKHKREMRVGPPANPEDRRTYWVHLKSLESEELIFYRTNMVPWWKYCLDYPDSRLTYDEWCGRQWGSSDLARQLDYKDNQWRWGSSEPPYPDRTVQIQNLMDRCLRDGHLKRFTKVGGEWGGYPGLLRPYLERPKYRIVYQGGKPHHRETLPGPIPMP